MKIKIIADNYTDEERFKECWGFSVLVNDNILFDTADSPDTFLYNTSQMDVDLKKIDKVVISHDHWDHTGGLRELFKINPDVKLYGLKGFSEDFRKKAQEHNIELIENDEATVIEEGIYTSGSFITDYKGSPLAEQALVAKTSKGLIVLLGCAHPGVLQMSKGIKERFKEDIYLVLGGFHLASKTESENKDIARKMQELGIKRVGPTHCTGTEAINIFSKIYSDNFLKLKTGREVDFDF
jgi:7,8-dihydropterin-6-yl-methyl-4-(beta-D-ribofuranosyl)aminobenzene 5'-phosphate synthase